MSHLSSNFLHLWRCLGGQPLEKELRFDDSPKPRKWRFDFAHTATKTAIEIEGGIWTKGRHTRGKGFISDCYKYNEGAMQGWAVIRLTTEHINTSYLERLIAFIEWRIKEEGGRA